MQLGEEGVSTYNTWPTRENPTMRKFNSLWLEQHIEKSIIERNTYSFLDWLGDVGGLYDGLRKPASMIAYPIAMFLMKSNLLT